MNRTDGGPAFPQTLSPHVETGGAFAGCDGMSLRDYFAAKAMQSMAADLVADEAAETLQQMASDAYAIADAMLAAREAE